MPSYIILTYRMEAITTSLIIKSSDRKMIPSDTTLRNSMTYTSGTCPLNTNDSTQKENSRIIQLDSSSHSMSGIELSPL